MRIYRARSSSIWGWLAIAVGAAVAIVHVSSAGISGAQAGLGLGVAAIATGVSAFLRPSVAVADDRAEIHNVMTTTTVPFARLERIETRWTLELVGDDGRKVGSFAAPAPGAAQSHRLRREADRRGDAAAAHGSPGELAGTPSGDAAALVRDAWDAWRSSNPEAQREGASSTRRPDPIGIALVIVAVAAAAWGLFG